MFYLGRGSIILLYEFRLVREPTTGFGNSSNLVLLDCILNNIRDFLDLDQWYYFDIILSFGGEYSYFFSFYWGKKHMSSTPLTKCMTQNSV